MSEITITVGGDIYTGWKSVRVTRTIQALSGAFSFSAANPWGAGGEWPLKEEDPCTIRIDGQTVLTGYIEVREPEITPTSESIFLTGYDRTQALVANSAPVGVTYRGINLQEFASRLAKPHGVAVEVQEGLLLPVLANPLHVGVGDKIFEALQRAAMEIGVLLVSTADGRLRITRNATTRADALAMPGNVLRARGRYDASERFRTYEVFSQISGDDTTNGAATSLTATATDADVRRDARLTVIRPSGRMSATGIRQRADWEARTRAGRADTVTCTVSGWLQRDGRPWSVNSLAAVSLPRIGANGDMLVTDVEFQLDAVDGGTGETTQLTLMRPDAFAPQPNGVTQQGPKKSWWKT